jgi:hypothetical protein
VALPIQWWLSSCNVDAKFRRYRSPFYSRDIQLPWFFLIPSLEVWRNAIFIVRFPWHYFKLLLTGKKSERDSNTLDTCMGLTKLLIAYHVPFKNFFI